MGAGGSAAGDEGHRQAGRGSGRPLTRVARCFTALLQEQFFGEVLSGNRGSLRLSPPETPHLRAPRGTATPLKYTGIISLQRKYDESTFLALPIFVILYTRYLDVSSLMTTLFSNVLELRDLASSIVKTLGRELVRVLETSPEVR